MNLDECDSIFATALQSKTESEFCHSIDPLFRHYEILSAGFGRGAIFWRARIIKNGEPWKCVDDMDFPPAHSARVGRLNDAGSPCFYAATREETAVAEIDAEEGQLVQIAGFRIRGGEIMRLAMFGEYSNVQKNGYVHFAGQDPGLTINKLLNSKPRDDALRTIYIDRFFAHVLADTSASEKA